MKKSTASFLISTTIFMNPVFIQARTLTDLNASDPYYRGISYCLENGIMTGYETGEFGANNQITRGQIATILWRMEGEPVVSSAGFADVPQDSFYKRASDWALQAGVFTGNLHENKAATFDGEDGITRQDLATIFYRYYQPSNALPINEGPLKNFSDLGTLGDWAKKSMSWAAQDLLLDFQDSKLDPLKIAVRGETAQFIQRVQDPNYIAPDLPQEEQTPLNTKLQTYCQNVYGQVGKNLEDLFNWTVNHIDYQSDGIDLSPEEYALKGFETGKGNCHAYASVFYYLAREAGYDARVINYQIRRADGGTQSHGWVMIRQGDKEYICDAEGQHTQGSKASFFMVDPVKPPVRYLYPAGQEPLGGYAKF